MYRIVHGLKIPFVVLVDEYFTDNIVIPKIYSLRQNVSNMNIDSL